MSTEYGYARVSSIDQNEVRQLDALRAVGIADERIYVDHKSGKDFNRSAWRQGHLKTQMRTVTKRKR